MSTSILDIRNLTKTYANGMEALKGVSFQVEAGDFFALLGPNGAGKSTTIGILSGLTNPTSGTIIVDGYDIRDNNTEARQKIGVVPQEFNFGIFEKVYDIVIAQAGYYGISREKAIPNTEKYLKALGLWEKRNVQARTLSGGMKRRLMIARALIHDPKILILDEPTAGVDIELRHEMYDFLREINHAGVTIILTTHYLEEVELLCKNIAIINKGKILQTGTLESILASLEEERIIITLDREYTGSMPDGYKTEIRGNILEITISHVHPLHDAITVIIEQGYRIQSLTPKNGRLEEYFLTVTQ